MRGQAKGAGRMEEGLKNEGVVKSAGRMEEAEVRKRTDLVHW